MLSPLPALLLAWPLVAQEPPAASPEAPAAQEPAPRTRPSRRPALPDNDPQAAAFLGELVAAQRVGEGPHPPVIGFRMDFVLRDFHPERGGNELEVQVAFRSDDGTIRIVAHDAAFNERVAKGFDEDGYWLRDGEGKLTTLEAKEYASDREAIEQTLAFCEDFLLLFDLDRLRERAGGLKLEEVEGVRILRGQLRRGRELWSFALTVPPGESLPASLRLELPKKPKPESAAQGTAEEPATAERQPPAGPEQAKPAQADEQPRVLSYSFGEWKAHAGRLLPSYIDEFHGAVPVAPRRSVDVQRFTWRELESIRTARGATAQPDRD